MQLQSWNVIKNNVIQTVTGWPVTTLLLVVNGNSCSSTPHAVSKGCVAMATTSSPLLPDAEEPHPQTMHHGRRVQISFLITIAARLFVVAI